MERADDGGLIPFAAIILGIAGVMRIFDAIWSFRYHGALPENLEGAIFGHSLKTYGWVDLIVAAVLIACAVLVFRRSQVARWVGITGAAIGCISAIWLIPYYPAWSLTYIALGAGVIYALAAYGGKPEAAQQDPIMPSSSKVR